MNISGILSGIGVFLVGVGMIIGGFFTGEIIGALILGVLGLGFAIVGLYMLLNSEKEDKIEQIRKK